MATNNPTAKQLLLVAALTANPKQLLLAAGLTAPWVADEPAELISFCQCYACGEEINASSVLTFWKCPACGQEFARAEHTDQEVA
jgi:predicted RNA-binding Zn-ribbon protein involved in translation (DUF1610 family)